MTTATTFVRQNDAGLRVRTSKYGHNLVLVVVLSLPADVLVTNEPKRTSAGRLSCPRLEFKGL